MARLVSCDSCGKKEPEDISKDDRDIRPIKLTIIDDPRTNVPEGKRNHEADLCSTCVGTMLHAYFDVPAQGKLEVPGFAQPVRALESISHGR